MPQVFACSHIIKTQGWADNRAPLNFQPFSPCFQLATASSQAQHNKDERQNLTASQNPPQTLQQGLNSETRTSAQSEALSYTECYSTFCLDLYKGFAGHCGEVYPLLLCSENPLCSFPYSLSNTRGWF